MSGKREGEGKRKGTDSIPSGERPRWRTKEQREEPVRMGPIKRSAGGVSQTYVKIRNETSCAIMPIRVIVDPSLARLSTAPRPPPETCMKKVMQSDVTKIHDLRLRGNKEGKGQRCKSTRGGG